jgi:hypothetical protein
MKAVAVKSGKGQVLRAAGAPSLASSLPSLPSLPSRLPLLPILGNALLGGTVLALAGNAAHAGGIDGVQLKLAWQLQQPVRWDNVSANSPYWLDGAQVQALAKPQAGLAWQVLQLQPGQRVALRLPRGEAVRVQAAGASLQRDDVHFWRSNGVGSKLALALRETARLEQQGQSLLLDQLPDETSVIVLERPASASGSLRFGLFVSRHEEIDTLAPYRQLHELAAPEHRLRMSSSGAAQRVWALAGGQAAQVRVQGPARLMLAGRWHYPQQDGASTQQWQVAVTAKAVTQGSATPPQAAKAEGAEVEAQDQLANAPQPLAELHYVADSETDEIAVLDGKPGILSGERSAWFEVPAGEYDLTLVSSGPFLARLLQQELMDYRFAQHNAGLDLSVVPVPGAGLASSLQSSPWRMPPAALQAASGAEADQAQQAARRLQQDNRHQDGGLLAAALMHNAAEKRRDVESVRQAARDIKQQNTFLQDLLPEHKLSPEAERFAWFVTPRLKEIGARGWGKVVAAQHEDALLGGLGSGRFVALPEAAAVDAAVDAEVATKIATEVDTEVAALSYALPNRSASGSLQLALQAGSAAQGQRLFVQFDQRSAFELRLDAPINQDLLSADTVSAALQLQALRAGEFGGSTVDAAFVGRMPAALVAAGVVEIPLPAGVGRVKVWRAGNMVTAPGVATSPLRVALKLRMARPFQLSEQGMLSLLQRVHLQGSAQSEPGLQALLTALTRNDPASRDSATRELDSQLQGLARVINAQTNAWANSVINPDATPATADKAEPKAEAKAENKAARQAARDAATLAAGGNWLPALEKWAAALASRDPALREQAEQGRVQALLALGENFLAEQMLKQRLMFGATPAIRQQATSQLADIYRTNRDDRSALALACNALARTPDSAALVQLVLALQDNDHAELALQAGLLLPPEKRPLPQMLRAALQLNWPTVFEQLRADLPDASEREFWRGQQLARAGKLAQAANALTASAATSETPAGAATSVPASVAWPDAAALATHLQQGQDLHRQITAQRAAGRDLSPALVGQWANWQATHPGPRQWQEVPGQVYDYAGATSLYALNRDLVGSAWRAEAGKPVRMRFMGPLRLRFEARPLHAADSQSMFEGWLKIEETSGSKRLWPVAISQNWPADGLQLPGRSDVVPGQAVFKELEFGPGWHELALSGDNAPLLINAKAALPALLLPVLPLLTMDTVRGQAKVGAGIARPSLFGCRDCTTVLQPGADKPLFLHRATAPLANGFGDMPTLATIEGDSSAPNSSAPNSAADGSNASDSVASLIANQRWDDLLALPEPQTPEAVIEYLSALLWRSEQAPQRGQRLLARASSLQAAHPELAALGTLMERLARNSDWLPVQTVQASAGMRSRPISGWEPETPAMRVRRALLAANHPDEYLITGGNRLLLNLFNTKATSMTLLLTNRDVGGLPALPLTAQVQIDNGKLQTLELGTSVATGVAASAATSVATGVAAGTGSEAVQYRLPLNLGKGRQSVKIWIKKPIANQFLGARLLENHVAKAGSVIDASERFYHVATHAEPVKLLLPGPVWVRVDHWQDGQTHSRYRLLDKDWNKFSLVPRDGQKEGLFRLFTRQVTPARPVTPPRRIEIPPLPVGAPLVVVPEAESAADLRQANLRQANLRQAQLPLPPLASAAQSATPVPASAMPLFALLAGSATSVGNGLPIAPASTPLHDSLPLGGQEAGTWSLFGKFSGASLQRFDQSGQTIGTDGTQKRFNAGATYRFMAPQHHNWYRADMFAQTVKPGGKPGLGLAAALTHDPGWAGLMLGLEGSALLQNRVDAGQSRSNLQLAASIRQAREISPSWSHEPKLRLVLRQSANALDAVNATDPLNAAQNGDDLLNPDGQNGQGRVRLEIGDKLRFRPRLDTLLSSQIKATSKANLSPQALAINLSGKQMLGPLVLDLQFDAAHFRADGGSIPARTLRSAALAANYEHWLGNGYRIEVGANLKHDLNLNRVSAGIAVALHMGNGRGYLDFAPDEIAFRDLRQRRINP